MTCCADDAWGGLLVSQLAGGGLSVAQARAANYVLVTSVLPLNAKPRAIVVDRSS